MKPKNNAKNFDLNLGLIYCVEFKASPTRVHEVCTIYMLNQKTC